MRERKANKGGASTSTTSIDPAKGSGRRSTYNTRPGSTHYLLFGHEGPSQIALLVPVSILFYNLSHNPTIDALISTNTFTSKLHQIWLQIFSQLLQFRQN